VYILLAPQTGTVTRNLYSGRPSIIFHSSQTDEEGRNIVLFNHASVVEHYNLPTGTNIDINIGRASENGFDDSITIFESIPDEQSNQS